MPLQRGSVVLVDTNVLIEAHRKRCWNAIAQAFDLHTVEKVVEETQTGAQNRRVVEHIDLVILRQTLKHVASITQHDRASFKLKYGVVGLDPGEQDLWVYADSIPDVWFLNSPDVSSIRFAHQSGNLDRLVSLGEMMSLLGQQPAQPLASHFLASWLSQKRLDLRNGILV